MSEFIIDRLLAARKNYPDAPFLVTQDAEITYAQGWDIIDTIAACIEENDPSSPFIGILSERGESAYYGTLATIACGRSYVSLTAKNPNDRIQTMTKLAEIKTVLVGTGMEKTFYECFADFPYPVLGISFDTPENTSNGNAQLIHYTSAKTDAPEKRHPKKTLPTSPMKIFAG